MFFETFLAERRFWSITAIMPGHCAVFREGDQDYLVFNAYHGQTGKSELKISTMEWKDGWPIVAPLP